MGGFMLSIKRGASVIALAVWRDKTTKDPRDLSGSTIRGQVRDRNKNKIADINCTLLDQVTNKGKVAMNFGETAGWPTGKLYFDLIREVIADDQTITVYSKTAVISVGTGVSE